MTRAEKGFHFDDRQDLIKRPKLLELFAFSPEFATVNGYHGFDDRLSRADTESIDEEFRFLRTWLQELKALPHQSLSVDQQLDLKIFEQYFALHQYYYEEIGTWKKSPDAITHIGQLCFLMLLYETSNEEKRFADIIARLEALPQYVREFKTRLEKPPRRWVELTVQTTQHLPLFFDAVVHAADGKISLALQNQLVQVIARTKAETSDYLTWLKTECAIDDSESWVLGPTHFDELIRLRHLGLTVPEILALGEQYLAQYEIEYRRLAKALVGSEDIDAAKALIEKQAPADFHEALATTRRAADEAKQFVVDHTLMSLPSNGELRVMETPPFLRLLIPFAAIFPPARFAPKQIGNYIVTPPKDPIQLGKHLNLTAIYNTAVHEGYPGHHLQLSTANLESSILRSAPFVGGKPPEYIEGWAHYCEEMMKDHGFHDTTEGRFVMVGDLVWRATRIIVDVKLSRGEISYDQAVQMLIEKGRIPAEGAQAEVNRYTFSPGYQLSYLIGKHLIRELKTAVQQKEGATFREASFHDRLLRAGAMPITLLREHVFGIGRG